jgi:hypothetical protein
MAVSQAQKSIRSLHEAAGNLGFDNLLEISSKSENKTGVALSAFNLQIQTKKYHQVFTVEMAFQGSKVFARGGPFTDLLQADSRTAKRDPRLKESGELTGFKFFGTGFPLEPKTYFYDWLYINALSQHASLSAEAENFDGFTDIVFNPEKSVNCQAFSAALYVSLARCNKLEEALNSKEDFLNAVSSAYAKRKKLQRAQDILI